ncbi:hypothetical protein AAG906_028154 [Vitis piasezkii]
MIVRDINAIPVSDCIRRLHPDTLEALMCAQSWLWKEKEANNALKRKVLVFYFRLTSCVIERNLLKGITADENTTHMKESSKMDTHFQSIELLDQPKGGANALNINKKSYHWVDYWIALTIENCLVP